MFTAKPELKLNRPLAIRLNKWNIRKFKPTGAATGNLLIPFRKGDKWGYCNTIQKIIIPCIYEEACLFKGDSAKI
ncbi:MAG: WG repeat-containing protein, partial [Bacteroidota bacterium]|nr:WG repeat-containing protein [Bacteroidota bacterium]